MADDRSANFICPDCGAHYKVVRMKKESGSTDRLLRCKVCNRSIPSTDGEQILTGIPQMNPELT
jgi:predicted Zn finger-like uncharacterized protein